MNQGKSFEDLSIKSWIIRQCQTFGIVEPTPVQVHCIPPVLSGSNVIGVAETGSGKTLAFAIPIIQTLSDDPYGIYALILTPTRELAFQIRDQFAILGKPINLRVAVIIGGQDNVKEGQELFEKPHIVIATPGRLADHLRSCDTFSLKKIRYLVLDEADRLLENGFHEQLNSILTALSPKRQTLLFTATMSEEVTKLQSLIQSSHSKGSSLFTWTSSEGGLSQLSMVSTLEQHYVLTPVDFKDAYLLVVLQKCLESSSSIQEKVSIIIFVKTCKICQTLSMTLQALGYNNVSLHSSKAQKERLFALHRFKSRIVKLLIATDVASRGLDIPSVHFVINHNVPSVSKDYVHRVGRTARAGRNGISITLITPVDVLLVEAIEKLTQRKLTEFKINEEHVAQISTQVSVVRREQNITLSSLDFEEKRNLNKRKRILMEGSTFEEEEAKKRNAWKEKRKIFREKINKVK